MNRYMISYDKNGTTHEGVVTEAQKDSIMASIKAKGYKVTCQKCYPFSMAKNGHNFFLIYNMCVRKLYEIQDGDVQADAAEIARLEELKERAGRFQTAYSGPVAWVPWTVYQQMQEMANSAILQRDAMNAAHGRATQH